MHGDLKSTIAKNQALGFEGLVCVMPGSLSKQTLAYELTSSMVSWHNLNSVWLNSGDPA